jgi:trans-aconitate 2-methyltransferase
VDLIYANASLHWLDNHETPFPRLLGLLAPGGFLAVQMPSNHDRPSHQATFAVVEAGPWWEWIESLLRRYPVAEPGASLRWLSPGAQQVDLWKTDYLHLLEGLDPMAARTRGSLPAPLVEALEEAERSSFYEANCSRLREAYLKDGVGPTPFWLRRLFMVARSGTPG